MSERGCKAVGIDLGTTYSALAYIDSKGDAHVVQDSSGQAVTPSVVLFDEDEVIVGDIALEQAPLHPDRVVQFVKTNMGDEWRFQVNDETHTPESISGIILAHLVREAEPQIGQIESAVITVPAYFTEKRRRATEQAGEIAGLNVVGTLNEPTAAALAYGLYNEDKEQRAVVYDLGGGTFDVTIVRISPMELDELATLGNRKLGGKDWDHCLVEHVVTQFEQQCGVSPRGDAQAMQDLWIHCEQAKRRLGKMKKQSIRLQSQGHNFACEVTRDEFEAMTAHLLQTTKLTTEMALEDAGLKWDEIDRVILVGGSTHMPAVQQMLEGISGRKPEAGVNPVLAVALGAARYAELLEKGEAPKSRSEDGEAGDGEAASGTATSLPQVRFVTAHGVGLKAVSKGKDANVVLIHKNSQVPCSVSRQFKTHVKGSNRQRIVIDVTQGDTQNIDLAEKLGRGYIDGLPADATSGEPVQVKMSFDAQGRLHVLAVYVKTGQELSFNLDIPGGLNRKEVTQYREMLEAAGLVRSQEELERVEHQPLPDFQLGDIDFDDIEMNAPAATPATPPVMPPAEPPPAPAAPPEPPVVMEPIINDPAPEPIMLDPAPEPIINDPPPEPIIDAGAAFPEPSLDNLFPDESAPDAEAVEFVEQPEVLDEDDLEVLDEEDLEVIDDEDEDDLFNV